uniref:uncharacterized protein LOC101314224 n=1 Tax=Fragaria vesca subsp. vesca TaxID=101020 RepID=UPI0005CB2FF6|nr:PREDICTED: uncharacterized protein LOC101314224 [Fragaria vesca subsp. vesca]
METLDDDGANIGFSILMRFTDATSEIDLEIRKLITVICQVLRDHKAPPTPVPYLRAACSCLDLIAAARPRPSREELHARFTILSYVIPKVPVAFLVNNLQMVCNSLGPALRVASLMWHDAAACAGIKCIAQLLISVSNYSWSQVSETFGFLLSYANDNMKSFEVRKQARLIVYDTLQSFVATPLLLGPAIKTIMDLFMNYYPIRPTSDGVISLKAEDTLDLVIVCLGVMSTEDRTAVLVYLKELLELNHTDLTGIITDALHRLFLNPSLPDVPVELLLELICSICLSVSQHKTKYIMKKVAGLLNSGVPKIYSLNKQICKTKLPVVFNALIVLLEQSEEVTDVLEAGNAFKCLIAYIDDSLIKQGVDSTLKNANMDDGSQSQPTLIEKLCATFQKLLSYPTELRLVFEIVSAMFEKLGEYSSYLMRDTVKTLADMQKLCDNKFFFKEEGKLLLKMVVEKCGLDAIMAIIPQEHVELLAEINQQLGSKSVDASSRVVKATTYGNNLSQSMNMHKDDLKYVTFMNYKLKTAGKKCLSDRQLRAFLDKQAKRRAEKAISGGLAGAAKMTKKLKL